MTLPQAERSNLFGKVSLSGDLFVIIRLFSESVKKTATFLLIRLFFSLLCFVSWPMMLSNSSTMSRSSWSVILNRISAVTSVHHIGSVGNNIIIDFKVLSACIFKAVARYLKEVLFLGVLMSLQCTINRDFELVGRCCYSGSVVKVEFYPCDAGEGIVFDTLHGCVSAKLENAMPSRRSIMLRQGRGEILAVEHVLSNLYAHGVDNVYVKVRRVKGRTIAERLAYNTRRSKTETFPSANSFDLELCDKLDEIGLKELGKEREVLRLSGPFERQGLFFYPIESGLVMNAKTVYSPIGKQEIELEIKPERYREELAFSRPYMALSKVRKLFGKSGCSLIASILNYDLGIGHGFTEKNVFLPTDTTEEWINQEVKGAEVARHSIVDRLGAIALLGKRLEGVRCEMYFSSHANDLKVLRELVKHLDDK